MPSGSALGSARLQPIATIAPRTQRAGPRPGLAVRVAPVTSTGSIVIPPCRGGKVRACPDRRPLARPLGLGHNRRVSSDESRFVVVEDSRVFDRRPLDRFDRIAFAMRALGIVRPASMRVAVYTRSADLRVERGRDLAAVDDSSWALVGIPPDASRESIAHAIADLAGLSGLPFVVDLLALAGAPPES